MMGGGEGVIITLPAHYPHCPLMMTLNSQCSTVEGGADAAVIWMRWHSLLSLSGHLQADCELAGNRRSVPWQPWQVFADTLTLSQQPRGKHYNIITHSVGWTRSINNMIIFCSSTGTRVLNRIWQIRKQPALLYSFQCCLAYLPLLPCIWCKPIRFKMCLLKDYLCWFPPSFLSQPIYKCSVHCIVYFAVD